MVLGVEWGTGENMEKVYIKFKQTELVNNSAFRAFFEQLQVNNQPPLEINDNSGEKRFLELQDVYSRIGYIQHGQEKDKTEQVDGKRVRTRTVVLVKPVTQ